MLLYSAVLLGLVLFADGQVPRSPCPEVFEYVRVGSDVQGLVKVPHSPAGSFFKVRVAFTFAGFLTTNYTGAIIKIVDSRVTAAYPRTANFRIDFPTQKPIPTILEVDSNGRIYCRGPPVPDFPKPPHTTRIALEFNQTNYQPRPLTMSETATETATWQPTYRPLPVVKDPNDPDLYPTTSTRRPSTTTSTRRPSTTTSTRRPSSTTPTRRPSLDNASPPESCGETDSEPLVTLIYDGVPIRLGDWPWLAALFKSKDNTFFCAGTLVDMNHVVTAAHCMYDLSGQMIRADEFYIVMGRILLNQSTVKDQKRSIARVVVHEQYNVTTHHNDIAILELDSSLTYTRWVRPICLWDIVVSEETLIARPAIVAGWGQDETGKLSDRPKMAEMPIVSQETCRSQEKLQTITTENTLCAGHRNGTGPCLGDSGGGLVYEQPENNGVRYYFQGLVSVGVRKKNTLPIECDLSQYTVFTNVNKFNDWIRGFIVEAK